MPYIYKITNTLNQKCYIGKTSSSVENRWKEHIKDRLYFPERPLYRAMNKYGIEIFSIETIEQVETDEQACEREIYWISYFDSYHFGYNATLGGEGKQKVDPQQVYALWQEGLCIKEIAEILGFTTECIAENLEILNIGAEERKQRAIQKISKPILMLSLDGKVLKCFSSAREASRYLIDLLHLSTASESGYSGHIIEVCKGKRKTCKGYKWKYGGVL